MDRPRSRDGDRDRSRRDDRRGYRSRSRSRGRRRRDRSRSRSRGRRRRDRSRDRTRSGSKNPALGDYSEGHYGRGLDQPGGGRPAAQAPQVPRGATADDIHKIRQQTEIDDLTKDQRTVFVSQLVMKATEKQIRKFFEKVGKVRDVIMIRDKYTNRHKGYAYVELNDLESVPMVLMLNGTVPDFQRFPILVKASEAEKNFLAKQESAAAAEQQAEIDQRAAAPRRKLLVGNLHPNITEGDLRTVLAPFGDVESVDMSTVAPGSAVVSFVKAEDAMKASTKIAGIELGAGTPISVQFYEPGATVMGAASAGDWKFDNSGGDGVALGADGRANLMNALGQRAGLAPPPAQSGVGAPTAAFTITNMFDPAKEDGATWRDDIKADVTEECRTKGDVKHVYVDGSDPRGLVHVLFADSSSANAAALALHGRWFGGRAITCSHTDPAAYNYQSLP